MTSLHELAFDFIGTDRVNGWRTEKCPALLWEEKRSTPDTAMFDPIGRRRLVKMCR